MALASLKPTVLTPEGAQHIADHKYVSGLYTPLDSILNPWWNKATEMLPTWLAPNLVTLLGFFPLVLNYVLAWRFVPDFSQAPSRPHAFFASVALFFYQTMDAMDGKQARRTGSSSPLGQLFDHGCDCLACMSHHSLAAMMLIPGPNTWTMAGLASLQGAFFLAQWQEYHTGVLKTSFGPVGVTETQYGLMLCGLICGIAGPDWVQSLFTSTVQVPWSSQPQKLGCVGIVGWTCFVLTLSSLSFSTTLPAAAAKGQLPAALLQLVSVGSLIVLMFLWEPLQLAVHVRVLFFLSGLSMFFLTAKMILFSMAKMHYPTFHWDVLAPYAVLVAASWLLGQAQFGFAMIVVSVVFGLRVALWLWAVLDELREKLQIYAFTLEKRGD